jgi:hypothetical protein
MKSATCKSVCREIEEAELNWQPANATREHLRGCQQCRTFHEERTQLRQIVGSLQTVTAPADFDFKLRARLAGERPTRQVRPGWFAFGYPSAAVATLLLIFGSVYVYRGWQTSAPVNSATVPVPASPGDERKASLGRENDVVSDRVDAGVDAEVSKSNHPLPKAAPKTVKRSPRSLMAGVRTTARDFSTFPAPVVTKASPISDNNSSFPIDAYNESIQLSLDDSGVVRTISLPRVSFGSSRTLAGEPAMVKASAKGVW